MPGLLPPWLLLSVNSMEDVTPTVQYSGPESICDPFHTSGADLARLPHGPT